MRAVIDDCMARCMVRWRVDSMTHLPVLAIGGVLHDAPLGGQSAHSVRSVLAPKADGARNLLASSAAQPLQIWNAFSSVASFMGSAGQGNYAAANSTLDAMAGALQAQGLPGDFCISPRNC